jgi:hypothetical protein
MRGHTPCWLIAVAARWVTFRCSCARRPENPKSLDPPPLRAIRPTRARRPSDASVDQTDARWPDLDRWQFVEAVLGGFHGTLLGFGNISGFVLRSMTLAVGGGLVVLLIYGMPRKLRA